MSKDFTRPGVLTWNERNSKKKCLRGGSFHIIQFSWAHLVDIDAQIISPYYYAPHTPHLGVIGGQNHYIGFQNPELSQLLKGFY